MRALPVADERLDAVCLALAMQPVFLETPDRARPLLDRYEATRPVAVEVGRLAHEQQLLVHLRARSAEASEAVNGLAQLYRQVSAP